MDSDVIFIAILIAIGATATVWDVAQVLRERRRWRDKVSAPTAPEQPARPPATLEGVLVRQVMTGVITAAQYQRAMTAAALRDEGRRPLVLPPDLGPPQVR